MTKKTCIIFGVSGIVGRNLAEHLVGRGDWKVIGVSRHRPPDLNGIEHRSCDLNDPDDVKQALRDLGPISCAFYATWSRQANEHANCLSNGAMFRKSRRFIPVLSGLLQS